MGAYDDSPASMTRAIKDLSRPPGGDPARVASAIIESVDQNPAPLRIALGSDSYTFIEQALTERLAMLEAQKDLAFSTDVPG